MDVFEGIDEGSFEGISKSNTEESQKQAQAEAEAMDFMPTAEIPGDDPRLSMSNQKKRRFDGDIEPEVSVIPPALPEIMRVMTQKRYSGVGISNDPGDIGNLEDIPFFQNMKMEWDFMWNQDPETRFEMIKAKMPDGTVSLGSDKNTVTVLGKDGKNRDFALNAKGFSWQDFSDLMPDMLEASATAALGSAFKLRKIGLAIADFVGGAATNSGRQLAGDKEFSKMEAIGHGLLASVPGVAMEGSIKGGKLLKKVATAKSDPETLAKVGVLGVRKTFKSTGDDGVDQLIRTNPDAADYMIDLLDQQSGEVARILKATGGRLTATPSQLLLDKGTIIDAIHKGLGGSTPILAAQLKKQNVGMYREIVDMLGHHSNVGIGKKFSSRDEARKAAVVVSQIERKRLKDIKSAYGGQMDDIVTDADNQKLTVDMYPLVEHLKTLKSTRAAKNEANDKFIDSVLDGLVPTDITNKVNNIEAMIVTKKSELAALTNPSSRRGDAGLFPNASRSNPDQLIDEIAELEESIPLQYQMSVGNLSERKRNLELLASDAEKGRDIKKTVEIAIAHEDFGIKALQYKIAPLLESRRAEYSHASSALKNYDKSALGGFVKEEDVAVSAMGGRIFSSDPEEARLMLKIVKGNNPELYSFLLADQASKSMGLRHGGDIPDNFTSTVKSFIEEHSLARELLTTDLGKAEFYNAMATVAKANVASGKGIGGVGRQLESAITTEGTLPIARAGGSMGQTLSVIDNITSAIMSEKNVKIRKQLEHGLNNLITSDSKGIAKLRKTMVENMATKGRIDNITNKLKIAFVLGGKLEIKSRTQNGRDTGPLTGAAQGASAIYDSIRSGITGSGGLQP